MKVATAAKLGRISNLPTVWSNVLAGLVLAGATTIDALSLLALALAATLFYVGGMFLNDAYDAEIDARERAERPIPAGEVARATVFAWGHAMLAAGLGLASLLGMRVFVAALATAGLIIAYDVTHKRLTTLAPVLMGLCRVGIYAMAATSVVASSPPPMVWIGALVLLAYVLGLTYAAAHENQRGAGPPWLPLLGLAAPLLISLPLVLRGWLGFALLAGTALWILRSLQLVRSGEPPTIRRGIMGLIAGIALVDALLVSGQGQPGAACLALLAFMTTLRLQRRVAGT